MELIAVTEPQKQNEKPAAPPPSTSQEKSRQAAVEDAVRRKHRTEERRDAARRQARSAFQASLARDRAIRNQNMEAGVEKMVRSVVRKDSIEEAQAQSKYQTDAQAEVRAQQQRAAQERGDIEAQARKARERLDAAYNTNTLAEPKQDSTERSQPSNHQQQRAVEDYQESTRNSIDRTVELVI